jgi:hypothetical protein
MKVMHALYHHVLSCDWQISVALDQNGITSHGGLIGKSEISCQSVQALEIVQVDDYVHVAWLYETSEYIDRQAFNTSKFVKLGHAGMECAPDQ